MDMALPRYVLQFIAIIVLLTWHCKKGEQKWWQWLAASAVGLGLGIFFESSFGDAPVGFYLLTVYLLLAYWRVLKLPFEEYIFYYSAGMLIQDAVFNAYVIFYYLFALEASAWWNNVVYLAVFAALYAGVYRFLNWWRSREGELRIQTNVTVLSILIFLINQMSQIFIVVDETYDWSNLELRLYSLLVCVLALSIQFGLFHSNQLQRDNEAIRLILHNERKQHALAAETVELINLKCHDLKQQIAAVRRATAAAEQEQELLRVEEAISFYDSMLKTGSDGLDTILGEKRLICEKAQIRLNFMGDGSALNVLRDVDLYTLIGNALDNAIECVRAIDDVEKRFILFEVRRRAGMAVIHIENCCETPLRFRNGLPETTKGDRRYHGYGMKSMQFIAAQYGGTLLACQKDARFVLNITIPLSQS
ncbi:MAG: ATP-binding protein [Clostridiales bacterium]|nr:ATP-binding protein [Clostridiales bacterium]